MILENIINSIIPESLLLTEIDINLLSVKTGICKDMIKRAEGNVDSDKIISFISWYENEADKSTNSLKDDYYDQLNIYKQLLSKPKVNLKNGLNVFTIEGKQIFLYKQQDRLYGMYFIGFDEFRKLYKYGYVAFKENCISRYNDYKILLSQHKNLTDLLNPETYFEEKSKNLYSASTIDELKEKGEKIETELKRCFNINNIRKIPPFESNEEMKLYINIRGDIGFTYKYNEVKLKLRNLGIQETDQLINIINTYRSYIKAKNIYENWDETDEDYLQIIKDYYMDSKQKMEQSLLTANVDMDYINDIYTKLELDN